MPEISKARAIALLDESTGGSDHGLEMAIKVAKAAGCSDASISKTLLRGCVRASKWASLGYLAP